MAGTIAFPYQRRKQHEHLLATAPTATRASREEPADLDHRDRPARRCDEYGDDHARDGDDDEDGNADRYHRCMIEAKLSVTAVSSYHTTHDERVAVTIHETILHDRAKHFSPFVFDLVVLMHHDDR